MGEGVAEKDLKKALEGFTFAAERGNDEVCSVLNFVRF